MELKIDLNSRIEEIEIYFSFAKDIDSVETNRQKSIITNDSTQLNVKRDLQKVIRANCYLLLYNFIEASVKNGILGIYDSIEDENISYQDLSQRMQTIWLSDKAYEINEISNHSKLKDNIRTLISDQVSVKPIKFSRSRITISGNLDYRMIEKLINDYGFHGRINETDKVSLAKALLKVKSERNSLAHGNKSFRQSAEMVTIQELFSYKDFVISYITDITNNITEYIERKAYKKV